MKNLKLGVIGCSNMGSAIVRGVTKKGIIESENILINDEDTDKAASLASETGCRSAELPDLAGKADYLLFAVKPQDFDALADRIKDQISGQTIVSIMAGVTIEAITEKIGKETPVIRAMPNMAAFASSGVTCISCNKLVDDLQDVKDIFRAVGEVMEVEEDDLDAVTAISGSGPAYLFFLADAMISAGEKSGLSREKAEELVKQTLYGSSVLLKDSKDLPSELIGKVASKGGTTEAALSVLKDRDVKGAIIEAVIKAKKRSEELSGR